MATIAENLQTLITNKANIKAAFVYGGVSPTDNMGTYEQLVKDIANIHYATADLGTISLYDGELFIPGNVKLKGFGLSRLRCSKIELGEGITTIPASCFVNNQCPLIIVPSTVTSINGGAFGSIGVDADLIMKPTTPPTLAANNSISVASGRTLRIYVPDDSVNAYKTENIWSNWANNIFKMSDYNTN